MRPAELYIVSNRVGDQRMPGSLEPVAPFLVQMGPHQSPVFGQVGGGPGYVKFAEGLQGFLELGILAEEGRQLKKYPVDLGFLLEPQTGELIVEGYYRGGLDIHREPRVGLVEHDARQLVLMAGFDRYHEAVAPEGDKALLDSFGVPIHELLKPVLNLLAQGVDPPANLPQPGGGLVAHMAGLVQAFSDAPQKKGMLTDAARQGFQVLANLQQLVPKSYSRLEAGRNLT